MNSRNKMNDEALSEVSRRHCPGSSSKVKAITPIWVRSHCFFAKLRIYPPAA